MKVQKLFLVIAAAFGILWVFLLPPFQAPDEIVHFCRIEELSRGQVMEAGVLGRRGGYLPQDLNSTISELGSNRIAHDPGVKQDIKSVLKVCGLPPSGTSFMEYENTARPYPPVLYLPQTAAALLARLFNLPTMGAFYMSRIFNLTFFISSIYLAIGITPCFKWGFLLLALVPISLQQAASVSPDAFINGIAFLWFAAIFKYSTTKGGGILKGKDLAVILALCALLTLSKAAYAPLALLVLLINPAKFGRRKSSFYLFLLAVGFINLVVIYSFRYWAGGYFSSFESLHSDKVSVILHNPLGVISSIKNVLIKRGFFSPEYIPGTLGWLDTKLPNFLTPLLLIMVIFAFAANYEGEAVEFGAGKKAVLAAALALSMSALFYFFLHPDSPRLISGVQGRYFIPLGVGFFTLFYSRILSKIFNEAARPRVRLNLYLGSITAGALMVSSVRIFTRYYLP